MADWNDPVLTTDYDDVLAILKDRDADLAKMFASGTPTNLPVGTIKWDASAKTWQKWNGSAWEDNSDLYILPALETVGDVDIGGALDVAGAASFGGAVTLAGNPSSNLHAAPKQYVDTNFQPKQTLLTAIAALGTMAADRMLYTSSSNTFAAATLSAFARTILDDANAAAVRSTIGAGTGNGTVTISHISLGSSSWYIRLTDGSNAIVIQGMQVSITGSGGSSSSHNWPHTTLWTNCRWAMAGLGVFSLSDDRAEIGVTSFNATSVSIGASNRSNITSGWVLGVGV